MAIWLRLPTETARQRCRMLRVVSGFAVVGLVLAFLVSAPTNIAQTMYPTLFGGLIVAAHRGIGGIVVRVLRSSILFALGTISYGDCVYYVLAPRAVGAALRAVDAPVILHSGAQLFLLLAGLTLLVATVSWRLMERPIVALGQWPRYSTRAVRSLPN